VVGLTGTTSGTWQYQRHGSSTWTTFGSVPASKPQLSANDLIRFVPNKGFLGTVTLKALAWDGGTGFSKAVAAATLLVNTAPVLNPPA